MVLSSLLLSGPDLTCIKLNLIFSISKICKNIIIIFYNKFFLFLIKKNKKTKEA